MEMNEAGSPWHPYATRTRVLAHNVLYSCHKYDPSSGISEPPLQVTNGSLLVKVTTAPLAGFHGFLGLHGPYFGNHCPSGSWNQLTRTEKPTITSQSCACFLKIFVYLTWLTIQISSKRSIPHWCGLEMFPFCYCVSSLWHQVISKPGISEQTTPVGNKHVSYSRPNCIHGTCWKWHH